MQRFALERRGASIASRFDDHLTICGVDGRLTTMAPFASRGISLANKCQMLFGLAVLLILTAALSVPWFRMQIMVDEGQFEIADQLADALLEGALVPGEPDPLERLRSLEAAAPEAGPQSEPDHAPSARPTITESPAVVEGDSPAAIDFAPDQPEEAAPPDARVAEVAAPAVPTDHGATPDEAVAVAAADADDEPDDEGRLQVRWISIPDDGAASAAADPFVADALLILARETKRETVFRAERREGQPFRYRYARAVRFRDLLDGEHGRGVSLLSAAREPSGSALRYLGPEARARLDALTVPQDLQAPPFVHALGLDQQEPVEGPAVEGSRSDSDRPDAGPWLPGPSPEGDVALETIAAATPSGAAAAEGDDEEDDRATALAEAAGLEVEGADIVGLLIIDHSAESARRQLIINRMYIILAGLLAILLAILVFYFITTRLILSPVRILRETAERVSRGDLYIRSDISTGDEFEELSDAFNLMLANWKNSQDQLRQMNKGLDLKLSELAESNTMLVEANRLKSEFLANVSHELRTPLNSILGFAEVIVEMEAAHEPPTAAAGASAAGGGGGGNGSVAPAAAGAGAAAANTAEAKAREKRTRYASNILRSGRSLLELINDLLDLAKIEAGRMEVAPEPTSVADVCEGLATLIRPQATKKQIDVEVRVSSTMPLIHTDPGKFQQILFNFLSNAVKFTPVGGSVTIVADRQRRRDHGEVVRISVTDTGPGISERDQALIFEKFHQVDGGHNRQAEGTGLGLAICRELSQLLGGWIEVESEVGRGSTFTLYLPPRLTPERPQSLMGAM